MRLIQKVDVSECPACGSSQRAATIDGVEDWFFGSNSGQWLFASCADCQSLYLDPRPADDMLNTLYRDYYTHLAPLQGTKPNARGGFSPKKVIVNSLLNSRFGSQINPSLPIEICYKWADKALGDRLKSRFRHFPRLRTGSAVLDVGCGSGRFLQTIEAAGWKAFGVDFDPAAIALARDAGKNVALGDISQAQNFGTSFDMITFNHVIEHVPDMVETLVIARNLLATNGYIHIETPNPLAPGLETYGRFWRGLEAPRHLCLLSPLGVGKVLKRAGFDNFEFIFCSSDHDANSVNTASRRAAQLAGTPVAADPPLSDDHERTFLRVLAWV